MAVTFGHVLLLPRCCEGGTCQKCFFPESNIAGHAHEGKRPPSQPCVLWYSKLGPRVGSLTYVLVQREDGTAFDRS